MSDFDFTTTWRGSSPDIDENCGPHLRSSLLPPVVREPAQIPVNLGELKDVITWRSVQSTTSESATTREVEYVSSYNWLGALNEPTIAIPGAPPRWAPPPGCTPLAQDSGTYYRDVNRAYFPDGPMHPTALAVLANPAISPASLDLVACASTLRSLIIFIHGQATTFRIRVQAVGRTVFFIRHEMSPRETIPNVRGYGHTMPEAFTKWDTGILKSVSNQRLIKYKFAGLNCLVRHEADGYFPDKSEDQKGKDSLGTTSDKTERASIQLDPQLTSIDVSSKLPPLASTGLIIKEAGLHVPQRATFELKTRHCKRKDEDFVSEYSPELWLTQTPYFVLAFHDRGSFDDIRIKDVRSEIAAGELNQQEHLKKFAGLLEDIIKRALNEPNNMLELLRHEDGDLEVRSPGDDFYAALPAEIKDRWTSGPTSGGTLKEEPQ